MVVAVTEAVKRPQQHSLRLVKAAPPCDLALLDLGEGQLSSILRIVTLGPISNTKTTPAADLILTCEHHADTCRCSKMYLAWEIGGGRS
jgi:hypothetical protein